VGFQPRPSQLTAIKYAAKNLLIGNTEAEDRVFTNRPTPLWPLEAEASSICLYFVEGKGDDRGQTFPTFYIHENYFCAECVASATMNSDDIVEALSQEVKDILLNNRYLTDPESGERTVARMKYSHYKMDLKAAMQDAVLASFALYFILLYEEDVLPPAAEDTKVNLLSASVEINSDAATGDGHAGPEISGIQTFT
jgi:hypothetical protein